MSNILPNIELARKRKEKSKIIHNFFNLEPKYKIIGLNKYFYVRTYGCQSNIRDSENIKGILSNMGYKEATNANDANIVILNTCAIRENAEEKVFGEVGFLKSLSKKKDFMFGICGCMAQEESVIKKIINKIHHVSFVFGTHNIYDLPCIIYEYSKTRKQIIKVYSKEGDIIENLPSVRTSNVKAFVNIMYGCDKFCSYCIVPYTRGKLRSRNKEDILKEINDLINKDYKEITLLGQNVNSYGLDKKDGYLFKDLLVDVCKTNIPRVRFATSNPWNFDKHIVDLCLKYKNLMPYFQLPIQSGSEMILEKMNRKMKIKNYIDMIKYIRRLVPNCAISTDIIVGFPNETDKQFNETLKLYKLIKFDNAYTFIYSKREGTPAANIIDKTPLVIKQKRLAILNELVIKYAKINNNKFLNKTVEVLVEGKSKTNDKIWTGYSPQWKVVNFSGKCKIGDIVKVKINNIGKFCLYGVIV